MPESEGQSHKIEFDPSATSMFHVLIEDKKISGSSGGMSLTTCSFSECSGLAMETEVFEYQEGGVNDFTHKLPGRTRYGNVVLKHGFIPQNGFYKLYKNMEEQFLTRKQLSYYLVTIELRSSNEADKTIMKWTLNDALPVKWVAPNLTASGASVAVESLEFAHHGITIEAGE
jgi:phage tail-like protein